MCQYGRINHLLFRNIKAASFPYVQNLVYVKLEVDENVSFEC
jgi:hypothetical protein